VRLCAKFDWRYIKYICIAYNIGSLYFGIAGVIRHTIQISDLRPLLDLCSILVLRNNHLAHVRSCPSVRLIVHVTMDSQHTNIDARQSTFNNVGRDQYNEHVQVRYVTQQVVECVCFPAVDYQGDI
jgi:hypothetical protein